MYLYLLGCWAKKNLRPQQPFVTSRYHYKPYRDRYNDRDCDLKPWSQINVSVGSERINIKSLSSFFSIANRANISQ